MFPHLSRSNLFYFLALKYKSNSFGAKLRVLATSLEYYGGWLGWGLDRYLKIKVVNNS